MRVRVRKMSQWVQFFDRPCPARTGLKTHRADPTGAHGMSNVSITRVLKKAMKQNGNARWVSSRRMYRYTLSPRYKYSGHTTRLKLLVHHIHLNKRAIPSFELHGRSIGFKHRCMVESISDSGDKHSFGSIH